MFAFDGIIFEGKVLKTILSFIMVEYGF